MDNAMGLDRGDSFRCLIYCMKSLLLLSFLSISILGLGDALKPRQDMSMQITYADGTKKKVPLLCRIATLDELEYFRHGGIMQYVLRNLAAA